LRVAWATPDTTDPVKAGITTFWSSAGTETNQNFKTGGLRDCVTHHSIKVETTMVPPNIMEDKACIKLHFERDKAEINRTGHGLEEK
jgi:hypothetical protein